MQRAIWILWPSFLVAAGAEGAFFSLFDPGEFTLFGQPIELSRTAIYSIGFFLFWGFAATSSGLSLFLQLGRGDKAPSRGVGNSEE
jgi:hypothetical protein